MARYIRIAGIRVRVETPRADETGKVVLRYVEFDEADWEGEWIGTARGYKIETWLPRQDYLAIRQLVSVTYEATWLRKVYFIPPENLGEAKKILESRGYEVEVRE